MENMEFNKNDPQEWLLKIRKLFKLWMYKADVGGGTTRFPTQISFQIPESKTSNKNITIPIQSRINYTSNNLNKIYMMISNAVRAYVKS